MLILLPLFIATGKKIQPQSLWLPNLVPRPQNHGSDCRPHQPSEETEGECHQSTRHSELPLRVEWEGGMEAGRERMLAFTR